MSCSKGITSKPYACKTVKSDTLLILSHQVVNITYQTSLTWVSSYARPCTQETCAITAFPEYAH